ncbi:MAG TPA: efflux RND transporter periplasmic adaptor subunit [Candidatus Acidoferrales bacterium]|nr:efflux RND transporter periplasmic adaptor subunit [Candidatus Acidoferrales bacterium]
MSRNRNFRPAAGILALVAVVLAASLWPGRSQVAVEVAGVRRMSLTSTVRATGEIRPLNYTNVLAQGYGRITGILVKDGQTVRPGDLLLRVDDVQPAADLRAEQAALDSTQAALSGAKAGLRAAQAFVAQRQADLAKARFDWERGQKLFEAEVISRQNFEGLKSAFNRAQAALLTAQAQQAQAAAQQAQAAENLVRAHAVLARGADVLRKTTYVAPIGGTVSYIAARVGEAIEPGVESSSGAYLLTISDMSVMIAEVRLNENDVVGIREGQPAVAQIDAAPGRTFSGRVTQVGTQAILQTSGLTTMQSTTSNQQAKEFKVDVTLDHPPPGLRPGMAVTTVIQTAHKDGVVAVPFQALVLRPASEVGRTSLPISQPEAPVAIAASPQGPDDTNPGVQGVFVVRSGRAIFMPVTIGILGENDVEVVSGPKPGDELVVGSFSALRELHSGALVKIASTPSG